MSIDERQYNASYISFRLAQVGGWFPIRAYGYLLSPNGQRHWERAVSHKKREGDVKDGKPRDPGYREAYRVQSSHCFPEPAA